MKKIVLLTYVTESNTDMKAVFNLKKTLWGLPDSEFEKFDVVEVLEAVEQ